MTSLLPEAHQRPGKLPRRLPGLGARVGTLSLVLLGHCGSSHAESSGDSGIVVEGGASDGDASEGSVADAQASTSADRTAPRCGSPCPTSEPSVGDPCDFDWCEYGGSPLFECDRSYGCQNGHVVSITAPDGSACATQSQSCPSSRASVTPGSPCGSPEQCLFPDGECDCLADGSGSSPVWFCSGPDGGSTGSCPVPRAPLGSSCAPPGEGAALLCQSLGQCRVEACSDCGTWTAVVVPCGGQ